MLNNVKDVASNMLIVLIYGHMPRCFRNHCKSGGKSGPIGRITYLSPRNAGSTTLWPIVVIASIECQGSCAGYVILQHVAIVYCG